MIRVFSVGLFTVCVLHRMVSADYFSHKVGNGTYYINFGMMNDGEFDTTAFLGGSEMDPQHNTRSLPLRFVPQNDALPFQLMHSVDGTHFTLTCQQVPFLDYVVAYRDGRLHLIHPKASIPTTFIRNDYSFDDWHIISPTSKLVISPVSGKMEFAVLGRDINELNETEIVVAHLSSSTTPIRFLEVSSTKRVAHDTKHAHLMFKDNLAALMFHKVLMDNMGLVKGHDVLEELYDVAQRDFDHLGTDNELHQKLVHSIHAQHPHLVPKIGRGATTSNIIPVKNHLKTMSSLRQVQPRKQLPSAALRLHSLRAVAPHHP